MKAMIRRLRRLEALSLIDGRPRERLRVVTCGVCGPANLEKSTCRRTLDAHGLLMEIVQLDGSRNSLTAEDFERFVESFPVKAA